jgi:hypothetical protein
MEAKRASNGICEGDVAGDGLGEDIGEVELEEPGIADDGFVADVTNEDLLVLT